MKELLLIFIGGGIGSVIRFGTSMLWRHLQLHPYYAQMLMPWPTLIVNLIGCLFISLFYAMSERWGFSPEVRLMLTTGFCGGLTTFSTFSYETSSLIQSGHYCVALTYVTISIVMGVVATFLPHFLFK